MSFPRYPAYKESGVEWLGEVPAHWVVTPTKHAITFRTGWTPPTGNADAYEGDNLWANISDLGERTLTDTAKRISDSAAAAAGILPSPRGSLLFSFKLSIGQVSIAGQSLYTNEAIATFLPSEQVLVGFAYYAFPLFLVQNATENIYGAKLLNQELIRSAKLALPPVGEQAEIATFLDRETAKIDALIVEQERLIELLKEKRQAVISHAVTKGLDPDVPMKDSGVEWLGEVPARWEIRPLKHVTELHSGGTPSKANLDFWDGSTPWASAKDLKTERLDDTEDHISDAAIEAGTASLLPAGSILVVVRGMILARTFPVTLTTAPMAINQDLKALVPFSGINPPYLARALQAAAGESARRIDEAGHGTKALRMETWTSLPLPVPPLVEQAAIAAYLDRESSRIDSLIEECGAAARLLTERRAALISAAVTGQIDVRDAAPAR